MYSHLGFPKKGLHGQLTDIFSEQDYIPFPRNTVKIFHATLHYSIALHPAKWYLPLFTNLTKVHPGVSIDSDKSAPPNH